MTVKQLNKYKKSIKNQFFRWSVFNLNKLDKTDKNIVFWKLFDISALVLLGFASARFLRKLMFRV
jgi:hypothetical protein